MPPEGEHRYRGSVLDVCRDFIEAVDTLTKKDEKKKNNNDNLLKNNSNNSSSCVFSLVVLYLHDQRLSVCPPASCCLLKYVVRLNASEKSYSRCKQ